MIVTRAFQDTAEPVLQSWRENAFSASAVIVHRCSIGSRTRHYGIEMYVLPNRTYQKPSEKVRMKPMIDLPSAVRIQKAVATAEAHSCSTDPHCGPQLQAFTPRPSIGDRFTMVLPPFTPTKSRWKASFQLSDPVIKDPTTDVIGRLLHAIGQDPESFRDYLDNAESAAAGKLYAIAALLSPRDLPSFQMLFTVDTGPPVVTPAHGQQQRQQQPTQLNTSSSAAQQGGSSAGTHSHSVFTTPAAFPRLGSGVVLSDSPDGNNRSSGPSSSGNPVGRSAAPDQLRGLDGRPPTASTVAPPPEITEADRKAGRKAAKKQKKDESNIDLCVEQDWDPSNGPNYPAVIERWKKKGFTTQAQAEVGLWMKESETVSSVSGKMFHSLKLLDKEKMSGTYLRILREYDLGKHSGLSAIKIMALRFIAVYTTNSDSRPHPVYHICSPYSRDRSGIALIFSKSTH